MTEHESTTETTSAPALTPGIDPATNRVSSDYLSCEIPEGWEASVNPIDAHYAFEMHPEGAQEYDGVQVLCIRMAPYGEDTRSVATPELLLALKKSSFFSLDNANKPFVAKPLDYYEVEGQGCRVSVMQVRVGNNDGFEFYLFQDGSRGDWLRATFYSWDEEDKKQLREAHAIVNKLASSMRAPRMEDPECIRAFQECLDEKVEPERFRELATDYANSLVRVKVCLKPVFTYIINVYKDDQLSPLERLKVGLAEFENFNDYAVPQLEHVMDAVDAQARYYEEGSEQLEEIRAFAAEIVDGVPVTHKIFEGLPDPKLFTLSKRLCDLRARAGLDTHSQDDANPSPKSESKKTASAPVESNDTDLTATMITLLSDDYIFFGDEDISWSRGHHIIKALQINSLKQRQLSVFTKQNGFDNVDDLLNLFMAFMRELEKDEKLIVPRTSISKALYPIMRRGNLTGVTLANLAAYMSAFRVRSDDPNEYTVIYDGTLAVGIPRFFGLMCRLIWDLRQCVEPLKGATFQVTFTSCHNPELAQLLRGNVSRVDGAQDNPGTVDVTDAPAIDLKHGVTLRPAAAAPEPATKPEPVAAPEPAPKPESVVKPVPEPKPAPEPKPQPKPAPQPKPTPQPKPAPEPEPKPTKSRSVDPMLPLTLLADDFVFFQGTDIAWERGHHVIRGIKANLPKMEQLNEIVHKNGFDSFAELGERLVSILLRVEKDKALVVPRNKVSKALYPILPDGDLTGITLANLTAYMAAFRVLDAGPNAYAVMYDPSLADGIPHFFGLMCRLLWDLRKCSTTMKDVPFRVTFTSYCVPDLPQLLEGCVWRDNGPKANPGTLSVIKAPQVDPKQWITPDPTAAAKWAPDISKKRMEFEIFLDRLLAAATKHAKAFDTLCRRYYTLDDSRDFVSRRMEQLTEGLSRAQGNQEFSKERFDENVAHKRELQENRKELISQTRQLEERARELEKQRADLGFFSIFKKVDIAVELSEIARQQDELRKRIKEIEDEHKSLTKSGMVLFCELREKEKQVARIQAKLERLSQKKKELTDRLESAECDLPALEAEDSEAKESMIRALAQYNGFISGLPFTSAERESNEYREMRELMVSTLPKLREQGLRPTGRAAFPTFRPDWEE